MYGEQIRSKVNIIWNILILIAFCEQPYLQEKYKNNGISGLFKQDTVLMNNFKISFSYLVK